LVTKRVPNFFFSSRRRHTRWPRDWSSDVCSSDLEWGGGLGARCRPNDPNKWGADAIFHLKDDKLSFANYYKMPAAQGDTENCVAHKGSVVPIPSREMAVQGW